MKNCGVSGGSGFIGSYVVEELERRGHQPLIFDHLRRDTQREVYLGDIRDATSVTEFAAHLDGMIHLAGVLGTQETITNPRPAAETNILGGLNVLEACSQYDVPLVNIAVGNFWFQNTYSITKNTVERFCEMFRKERGARVSVVRALNAYGPRQSAVPPWGSSRVRKIMPYFACSALTDRPIEVYGDGLQVMDMIAVQDVARVLVTALEATQNGGIDATLEAGSGRRTTVNDIAALVAAEVEKITHRRVEITHTEMRPGEQERSVVLGDPKTLAPIGMDGSDFIALEDGVAATVAYYAEMLG